MYSCRLIPIYGHHSRKAARGDTSLEVDRDSPVQAFPQPQVANILQFVLKEGVLSAEFQVLPCALYAL